jgi:hypothetical protein
MRTRELTCIIPGSPVAARRAMAAMYAPASRAPPGLVQHGDGGPPLPRVRTQPQVVLPKWGNALIYGHRPVTDHTR